MQTTTLLQVFLLVTLSVAVARSDPQPSTSPRTHYAGASDAAPVVTNLHSDNPLGIESSVLEVSLTDGSVIVGKLPVAPMPVRTEFAKMNLSWKLVGTIEFAGDRGAIITFQNGDRLAAVLEAAELKLDAIFGNVRVPIEQVARICVSQGEFGAARTGSRKGLVLYFPFDRDEGDRVSDRSGTGNHGSVHGVKWVSIGRDGACEFRGGSDSGAFIRVPHSASLVSMEKTRQITISAWVKPTSIPREFPVVVGKGGNQPPNAYGGYEIYLNSYGDNDVVFASGACDITTYRARGKWINKHLNEWIHIAFTLDISTRTAVCYVNGKQTDDLASPNMGHPPDFAGFTFDVTNSLYIGGPDPNHHTNRAWFDGIMDEIRIYDRVLSWEEITDYYRQEAARHPLVF